MCSNNPQREREELVSYMRGKYRDNFCANKSGFKGSKVNLFSGPQLLRQMSLK